MLKLRVTTLLIAKNYLTHLYIILTSDANITLNQVKFDPALNQDTYN